MYKDYEKCFSLLFVVLTKKDVKIIEIVKHYEIQISFSDCANYNKMSATIVLSPFKSFKLGNEKNCLGQT